MIPEAVAQAPINVTVPAATPCWQNQGGLDVWQSCGLHEDYIAASLAGMDWVLGGYLGMTIVSVIMLAIYLKYHIAIYPIIVGLFFIPTSYFIFPDQWVLWAMIMAGVSIGIMIWFTYIHQTRSNVF